MNEHILFTFRCAIPRLRCRSASPLATEHMYAIASVLVGRSPTASRSDRSPPSANSYTMRAVPVSAWMEQPSILTRLGQLMRPATSSVRAIVYSSYIIHTYIRSGVCCYTFLWRCVPSTNTRVYWSAPVRICGASLRLMTSSKSKPRTPDIIPEREAVSRLSRKYALSTRTQAFNT